MSEEEVLFSLSIHSFIHSLLIYQINFTWNHVYRLHFLRQAEQKAQKCQRGFVLRDHSPEVPCIDIFTSLSHFLLSSMLVLR